MTVVAVVSPNAIPRSTLNVDIPHSPSSLGEKTLPVGFPCCWCCPQSPVWEGSESQGRHRQLWLK